MRAKLEIKYNFSFQKPKHFLKKIRKVCNLSLSELQITQTAVFSFLFCNNDEITHLNAQFRGKNYPTNVLSFFNGEIFENNFIIGDIAISIPKITEEAIEQGKEFEDHLFHMVTHGVLHLLGFDHQTPEEQQTMEELEDKILLQL